MPISLGSGDDQDPNAFTNAIARRLGLNQTNQGYQYSSASPAVQNSEPAYQSTPSAGQPAPQQQDAPPNSRDLGMGAQAAARLAPTPYSGPQLFGTGGQVVAGRPGGLSGAFSPNESNGGALSPGIQAVTGQQNYRDLSPQQQNQMQQAGLALQAPLLGRDIANLGLNAPGILRGIGDLGGDFAGAIGRRFGFGAAGAADAERLAALRNAANVGQDAMRYGQPGRQGLGLADRIPGAAPYTSAPVGDIAQPLSDVAARNAALDAVRGASRFPSEIPAGEVATENLGGIGGALQRAVTNPNVYLGGGTVAGIGGAGLLAVQQGAGSGATNAATPTGSTGSIVDAVPISNNANNLAAAAGRGGSLAGPAQGGGTVGSQPTPTTPTIQQPTGGGGVNPQASLGSSPTGGGPTGSVNPIVNQAQSGGARGSVNPIVSQGGQGSQGGTGTVPTSGGLPSQGGPTSPSAQPSDLAALTQQAAQSLTGISSELANTKSPDVLNVFVQQGQSILDMLKQQEDQLRADAQTKGTTIDPATQFTLDTMQKQLDGQLQGVRENLNRRGLLQSGIELASENQVRSGSLSAQGQLLATRLSKIQQDLENGLKSVNSQRVQTASQFGLAGANAQASADNATLARRDDLLKALANASLTFRGQANTANEGALNRQNQFAIADANRQEADARLNQSQQFTAQQNDLGRQASDARQMAALFAAAGNAEAARQYSDQAAELQRQFQASQQQNQQTFTGQQNDLNRANQQPSTNRTKLATDNFIAQLEGATNKQSAMDAYNQALQDGTFQNAGADPLAILNAINTKQWSTSWDPFGWFSRGSDPNDPTGAVADGWKPFQ